MADARSSFDLRLSVGTPLGSLLYASLSVPNGTVSLDVEFKRFGVGWWDTCVFSRFEDVLFTPVPEHPSPDTQSWHAPRGSWAAAAMRQTGSNSRRRTTSRGFGTLSFRPPRFSAYLRRMPGDRPGKQKNKLKCVEDKPKRHFLAYLRRQRAEPVRRS